MVRTSICTCTGYCPALLIGGAACSNPCLSDDIDVKISLLIFSGRDVSCRCWRVAALAVDIEQVGVWPGVLDKGAVVWIECGV